MDAHLDTKEFDRVLAAYKQFTKRSVAEICNAKAYFVAKQAILDTVKSDKTKITNELNSPSKIAPNVPLAAIIVNKRAKAAGKSGLFGNAMKSAIKKLIGARNRSINFLRSGWIPAIKLLDYHLKSGDISFSRRYMPKSDNKTKQYGQPKGSAIYARKNTEKTFAQITNSVSGGKHNSDNSQVNPLILQGLQKAINKEVASMRIYIERKYNEFLNKKH